jgi:hypothetical protein
MMTNAQAKALIVPLVRDLKASWVSTLIDHDGERWVRIEAMSELDHKLESIEAAERWLAENSAPEDEPETEAQVKNRLKNCQKVKS